MTAATSRASGTPLLEVRNVSKYFGNVVALKDITSASDAGEVTCVLGDNGAGKSTFIKILSGVHRHDEGESWWTASDVTSTRRARRRRAGSPPSSRTWRRCR